MVARKVVWRVADTQEASLIDSPGQTSLSLSSGPAPSQSSDPAPAADRPAPGVQKARQHSRQVLWFGRWRLRSMQAQNVRG